MIIDSNASLLHKVTALNDMKNENEILIFCTAPVCQNYQHVPLLQINKDCEDAELVTVSLHVCVSWVGADQTQRKCSHSESVQKERIRVKV